MVQEVGCSYWENLQQISKGEVCVGHCHDWRRLWVLSDNVLGKYSTWTSSIYLQENRNLWLLTMFYLFKLTRLQFCNYCWAIRAYSHTCNQALSFSVLADLSHMLYIEKQVHFVPVAEFAVTLLCCTLLTIIFWPCNWLHLYVTGTACIAWLCHVCLDTSMCAPSLKSRWISSLRL